MKSANYAKLLADYPLSQKIFADAGEEPQLEGAPLPENPEPIVDPGLEEDEEQLFDPEEIKGEVRNKLANLAKDELGAATGEDYSLVVESLGDIDAAAKDLELEVDAEDSESIEQFVTSANELVADLAGACELPGKFEFEVLEKGPEEEPEESEEPVESAAEDVEPQVNLCYKFSEEDCAKLEELGYQFLGEEDGGAESEEPSFDEIMSNLVEAGHPEVARRMYEILHPVRKH